MKLRAIVLLCVVGLVAADDAKKKEKSDKDKVQGTWSVVSAEPEQAAEILKTVKFTFTGDKLMVKLPDQEDKEIAFKLDSTKKPKQIDMTPKDEDKNLGIYELAGDTLKLCITHKKDGERPKEFKALDEERQVYIVLKRDKK